ncbi:SMI1/KNR4 family protein [Paenibacillus sp. Root52]|uniref:SMI1/KNR4 family protein n=1 Tax=Paenibacillus sp. Root52 TaxID=1736552 RepID=UPI000AC2A660|nr:SMI1/KNR4 family protein [Paenibacillus sp. Root52]
MSSIEEIHERYIQLCPEDGIDENVLKKIEEILQLKLPDDFRDIAKFYSGDLLGGISCFAFAYKDIAPNIVDETLRLRNAIKLPSNFVVLAEPPNSIIIMDTQNNPSIIWCDATDVERIVTMSFISPPDTWKTFFDFFTKLVEDEEEEQLE